MRVVVGVGMFSVVGAVGGLEYGEVEAGSVSKLVLRGFDFRVSCGEMCENTGFAVSGWCRGWLVEALRRRAM